MFPDLKKTARVSKIVRKIHLEGSYIGGQPIRQLLPALFRFPGIEHTGRMDFRTTRMETCLLRSDLYFDHNFFIRTSIWVI
jgi:hypothetical protein